MESWTKHLLAGGISLVIAGAIGFAAYKILNERKDNTQDDKELSRLVTILRQIQREYLPILKYFSLVCRRLAKKPEVVSTPTRKGKVRQLISSKMYEALSDAEQDVIRAHGLVRDDYLRILARCTGQSEEIKEILAVTERLVSQAIDGDAPESATPLPESMTPSVYLRIYRRLAAERRQAAYVKLHQQSQAGANAGAEPDEGERESVREKACRAHGVVAEKDDRYSFLIRRAYYEFMCGEEFEKLSEKEKAENNKLMTVVMEGWVVPDMERRDVLDISDTELDRRVESQLAYVAQFVDPQRPSPTKARSAGKE